MHEYTKLINMISVRTYHYCLPGFCYSTSHTKVQNSTSSNGYWKITHGNFVLYVINCMYNYCWHFRTICTSGALSLGSHAFKKMVTTWLQGKFVLKLFLSIQHWQYTVYVKLINVCLCILLFPFTLCHYISHSISFKLKIYAVSDDCSFWLLPNKQLFP